MPQATSVPNIDPWIAAAAERIAARAQPWMQMSDDEVWSLMFAPTIPRAHHVWSDGHCPLCKASVPMYEWRVDAMKLRWKMTCPHCAAVFPTNDFDAYHRSGLDASGWFDPAKADRSLLFNQQHPDPADPLHRFGVDDGNGVFIGDHRWLFIAAYTLYGQWRQLVVAGIERLADAFTVTQNPAFAHKALILLDRVADAFPEFDFMAQGWMYEQRGDKTSSHGHVSYWCDNCEEIRQFADAYRVLRPRTDDAPLISFLAEKSRAFATPIAKKSGADLRMNIESRIFRDALENPIKFRSNFPRAEVTKVTLHEVLGTPESLALVDDLTEALIRNTVGVDGVTGEKGLPTYSAYVIASLADFMAQQEQHRPGFIRQWCEREPNLKRTWRFFLDTRCLDTFYPDIGDGLWFGAKAPELRGVRIPREKNLGEAAKVDASGFSFLWWLYEATGDLDYVRALFQANGSRLDHLPRDLSAKDPAGFRAQVDALLQRHGSQIKLPSVDKTEWHLAILRSGEAEHARALWIDYDTGGNHGHMDGMNVGLFAHGLSLIPDFGYPPVQFGGWSSPKSLWYYKTAAHNTVTIDGQSQPQYTSWKQINDAANQSGKILSKNMLPKLAAGTTTLWRDQPPCQVLRIDGREIYVRDDVKQYERTLMLVDVDKTRFYIVDIFRVVGGADHANFTHAYYGGLETSGLSLTPSADYGHETLMQNFRTDPAAKPGWSATWQIEDRLRNLPVARPVTMRRHDFTLGASASTCDAWINGGGYGDAAEAWIPRLMIRRTGQAGLSSCFVSVLEVYENTPVTSHVRRIELQSETGKPLPDSCVGLEIGLGDGVTDRVYFADVQNPLGTSPWPANSPRVTMVDVERATPVTRDVVWVRASDGE